jgi:cation diffusion facilitator CzcD-associated flavoprotein CzcO
MHNKTGMPGSADHSTTDLDAVVVGAGWAGLYGLHRLRKMGLAVRAYERAGGVGGTWYWNRYPGARCDVPILNYCFSFDEDLLQEWTWTERYAAQPEIERYANYVADKFDLRKDIVFNTRVESAAFDADTERWIVTLDSGDQVTGKYLVMGTGGYSVPHVPDIPGFGSFEKELYFTARWPTEPVSFAGKRVGIIGTGASGVQVISAVAQEPVSHLYVFQRTPNFLAPTHNAPLEPEFLEEFKKTYADFLRRARASGSGTVSEGPVGAVADLSDEEFQQRMDEAWSVGGPSVLIGISDVLTNPASNERVAEYFRARVRQRVPDSNLAELLSARGHYVGARRVVKEDGYFEIYGQPNVSLVDVRTESIIRLTADALVTERSTYDLDMLILATGFDSGTGAMLQVNVIGRDGVKLSDKWSSGPVTYLGLMAAGFPNLFMIAGPGSPSIRSTVIVSIEQQIEWLGELIEHLEVSGLTTIEAGTAAEESWTRHVAETADRTLLTHDDTQYVGSNVPGKPRVYLAYAGGVNVYERILHDVRDRDYEGFLFRSRECDEPTGADVWSGPPRDPTLLTRWGNPVM